MRSWYEHAERYGEPCTSRHIDVPTGPSFWRDCVQFGMGPDAVRVDCSTPRGLATVFEGCESEQRMEALPADPVC